MRIGKAALAAWGLVLLLTLPALAQTYTHVCFIEGGKREPAHFEPNGNVYVGRHATTEGLAFQEAIEACERGEGNRDACQGAMTPGAICRVMDPQRAASYQPVFRRPMNVNPNDYQCEARGTAPLGNLLGFNGQFHTTSNSDYMAARRAMEAICTPGSCDPMRCFRRSATPVQQAQNQNQNQSGSGGGTTATQNFQPGNVQFYWRQLGGNWRSQTVQNTVQACQYASLHPCDAPNIRAYAPGATQTLHVNGCNAPPIQVQCVVEAPNAGNTANPQAQIERFCADYATHAVNAANRAIQAGCTPNRAFTNDFNPDRALHYNWCLRTEEQRVAAGRQSRQQALDNCLANPGANNSNTGRPTGRYPPGERLIRNIGGWDLREHVRRDGTFERCTLTLERFAPSNVPRISLFDNNIYVLSLTAHESLAPGSRIPTRYTVNNRSYDGTIQVHPDRRSSMEITAVIDQFAAASDVRIPVRDRTYAWFMQGMPQAMTALRECRARFR